MSLVQGYSSSSESESESELNVNVPAVTKPATVVPPKDAPRKIIVAAKPTSSSSSNLHPDDSKTGKFEQAQDRSLSIFGKPSIASFLPAPKNRKANAKPVSGNSHSATASVSSVTMKHEVSKQTRTLGGGIKNKFFDGEVSMGSSPPPTLAKPGKSKEPEVSDEQPQAKKVKVIPAAVLARQAKAAKLAKLGKPIPANLSIPAPEPSKLSSQDTTPAPAAPPLEKPKINLPSLFGLEKSGFPGPMPGPSLPADQQASEYQPIMIEKQEQVEVLSSHNAISEEQPETAAMGSSQDTSIMAEIAKHELGNSRKRHNLHNSEPGEVIDFSMDEFYKTNADLRKQGLLDESKRPVQAIGSGRHQLTSLLRSAQNNLEGLEEMYAQNRRTKKDAGSKYGF